MAHARRRSCTETKKQSPYLVRRHPKMSCGASSKGSRVCLPKALLHSPKKKRPPKDAIEGALDSERGDVTAGPKTSTWQLRTRPLLCPSHGPRLGFQFRPTARRRLCASDLCQEGRLLKRIGTIDMRAAAREAPSSATPLHHPIAGTAY